MKVGGKRERNLLFLFSHPFVFFFTLCCQKAKSRKARNKGMVWVEEGVLKKDGKKALGIYTSKRVHQTKGKVCSCPWGMSCAVLNEREGHEIH